MSLDKIIYKLFLEEVQFIDLKADDYKKQLYIIKSLAMILKNLNSLKNHIYCTQAFLKSNIKQIVSDYLCEMRKNEED